MHTCTQSSVESGEDSADRPRARADELHASLGIPQTTTLFFNGKQGDASMDLSKAISESYREVLPQIQRAVYYRQLGDHDKIQDALAKLTKAGKRVSAAVLQGPAAIVPLARADDVDAEGESSLLSGSWMAPRPAWAVFFTCLRILFPFFFLRF